MLLFISLNDKVLFVVVKKAYSFRAVNSNHYAGINKTLLEIGRAHV